MRSGLEGYLAVGAGIGRGVGHEGVVKLAPKEGGSKALVWGLIGFGENLFKDLRTGKKPKRRKIERDSLTEKQKYTQTLTLSGIYTRTHLCTCIW